MLTWEARIKLPVPAGFADFTESKCTVFANRQSLRRRRKFVFVCGGIIGLRLLGVGVRPGVRNF